MIENHDAWDLHEAVRYYENGRNKPEDLYESERGFFFPVMEQSGSVLDLGCAAGGTYSIIRQVNPDIGYVGVDVSPEMIAAARRLFPEGDFRVCSGQGLDFPDNSFDTVLALGVFNHVPDWRSLLRECCRVARRYCVLDLTRLLPHAHVFDPEESYMVLASRFEGQAGAAAATKVPYVLTDAAEMFAFLREELGLGRILAKGYFGRFSQSVRAPVDEVCFTVVCLEKGGDGQGEIIADLPPAIRGRLAEAGIPFTEPFRWMLS